MLRTISVSVGVAAAFALFGSGSAAADNEYTGQTYAEASAAIQRAGGTDTVATVVGDQVPTAQCRVTGSRSSNFLSSVGQSGSSRVLLDLNCNADLASPGNPGNSVVSPDGRQTQQAQQQAETQQNVGDELLQSGEVPLMPNPIP